MLATLFKQNLSSNPRARAAAALVLAFSATLGLEAQALGAIGPFAHLAGSWSGGGTIATSNGTRERIRCQAVYRVGEAGNALQQDLKCASDSYKFHVISAVRAEDGRISGTWSETTRSVTGDVTGRAVDGEILATVTGAGFSAGLALITKGASQSVTIRPSGVTEVTEVAVSLHKG